MRKKVFIPIVIIFIVISIIGGKSYFTINDKLSRIKTTKISRNPLDLGIDIKKFNDKNISNNYNNILVMFTDDNKLEDDESPTDSMMILTLDKDHNKIKLTSIMRDILIDNVKEQGDVKGTIKDRIDAIYKQDQGKSSECEDAIKVINSNFDMNIKDYVKVDFTNLHKIVNDIGGIDINVSEPEVAVANKYIKEAAKLKGVEPKFLTHSGMQHLNGIQALGYTRIGVGKQDFYRMERQKTVLNQVFSKSFSIRTKGASIILNNIFSNIETSMSKKDILSNDFYIFINNAKTITGFRIPVEEPGYSTNKFINKSFYSYWNKEANITALHQFIFEGNLKTEILNADNKPKYLGIALDTRYDYNDYDLHFKKFKELNADAELVIMISVNNDNDYKFHLRPNDEIINAFKKAEQYGVDISLVKIHLVRDFSEGNPKRDIRPDRVHVAEWFTNYEKALKTTLNLINKYHFDNFVIANENNGVFQDLTLTPKWKVLVNNLRTSYPNIKFGYSSDQAALEWAMYQKNVYNNNTLLDYVDFIGFNVYPNLTYEDASSNSYDINIETKYNRKTALYNQKCIPDILKANKLFGKDIIITETGCTGRDNSLRNPIDSKSKLNYTVQGLYYTTIFENIASIDCVKGLYIWSAGIGSPFDFYNKSGEIVIKNYFDKTKIR